MSRTDLTAERLRQVFHYDPSTGYFTRIARTSNNVTIGERATSKTKLGYIKIGINGGCHYAQRLAFLYMTGNWPAHTVDHINSKTDDNRWENLRDIPHYQNIENQRRPNTRNTSGFLGVEVQGKGFASRITVCGKRHYLGKFATAEQAHAAYLGAKRLLHQGCTI